MSATEQFGSIFLCEVKPIDNLRQRIIGLRGIECVRHFL